MNPSIEKGLRHHVVTVAELAGSEIRRIYEGGEFQTVLKDDQSPLTLADRAAHDIIAAELHRLTPEIPVVSEESQVPDFGLRKNWQACWLVDPLDGTKEFIKRNGEFTVNIALVRGGVPVLGVVHAPAIQVTYSAARGEGAFKKEKGTETRLHVSDYHRDGVVVIASRSHAGDKIKALLERIPEARLTSIGSALKLCFVAEGRANFYPRLSPTMEWDTAAAHCVVEEAGGHLCTLDGKALLYNREDLKNPNFVVCGDPPYPWQKFRDLMV